MSNEYFIIKKEDAEKLKNPYEGEIDIWHNIRLATKQGFEGCKQALLSKAKLVDLDEAIATYNEYIKLLDEELSGLYGLAMVHGYVCGPDKVKRGKELRDKIKKFSQFIEGENK